MNFKISFNSSVWMGISLNYFFIGVYQLYDIVFVFPVQQNESVMCIHISSPLQTCSFSGHHFAFSRVSCATQYALISLYIVHLVLFL